MSEFLEKCYEAIMLQKTGIPETLNAVSNEDLLPLLDRRVIILTGAGDSYAVAQYGQWALTKARKIAVAISPPEIHRYTLDKDCLVIGITASGRSLSTNRALMYAQEQGAHTLIFTDNSSHESADYVDFEWITKSGVDTFDIAPTAPTTAAMAFLLRIAALALALPEIGVHEDSRIWNKETSTILDWAVTEGEKLADFIHIDDVLYLISEGSNFVAAHIGMMKFNEFSLQRTVISLREEFQHHYNLSLEEGNRIVLIADRPTTEDDRRYLNVLQETLEVPSYLLAGPNDPMLKSSIGQAIANTIAFQMASYNLVSRHKPNMEWFKMPNAKAFKIY